MGCLPHRHLQVSTVDDSNHSRWFTDGVASVAGSVLAEHGTGVVAEDSCHFQPFC